MYRPEPSEYAEYYARYVANVTEDDVVAALAAQMNDTKAFLSSIGEEKAGFRYAPGKWSIKEVVGHFTDAERVFGYRAVAIARGEQAPLPSFEETSYVANGGFDRHSLRELTDAYAAARQSNLLMYRQLPAEAWTRLGTASRFPVSVRAVAYITLGHERHHLKVLREKYLPAAG